MDLEKEVIYETDVLVMGTDGLWDVTSNERVAEVVSRSLEQFPAEDAARYRYRFTSAAQDLVMSSRGKLNERSWRTSDDKAATIDDISVFVIPLVGYKEDYMRWKQEQGESFLGSTESESVVDVASNAEPTVSAASVTVAESSPTGGYVSIIQPEQAEPDTLTDSRDSVEDVRVVGNDNEASSTCTLPEIGDLTACNTSEPQEVKRVPSENDSNSA